MTQYDNIIVTPVYGPLNSSKYPTAIPYHSYGILNGTHVNPPQFFPSQEPLYADMNTNARQQYMRTAQSVQALAAQRARAIQTVSTSYNYSTNNFSNVSTHMNYIAPTDSSLYIQKKKSLAIGKTGFQVGASVNTPYTTKNYYPSGTYYNSLRRVRGGGSVAPKKKGSIYNTSLSNGKICAWGSNPVRSTY